MYILNSHNEILTLVPQNGTLFGIKVFKDIIS